MSYLSLSKMYISHLRRLMPALCFHYTKSFSKINNNIHLSLSRLYESFINCKFICSHFISKKTKLHFNHRKCQKAHLWILSDCQGFPKIWVLTRRYLKMQDFLSILHFLHDKPLINYTFKISFTISFILSESHSLLCLI